MSTLADLEIGHVGDGNPFFKALVWGMPGAGKTRLVGSAYEVDALQPILFIDIEGGTKTIEELWPKIDRVRVKPETDSSGRIKRSSWQQCWDIYEALKRGEGGYTTVVVDNGSEGYQLAMRDTMDLRYAERPDIIDPDIPGLREYGKTGSQFRRWVRHLRDLDANVIMTAHELAQTDDNGNVRAYVPSFPGKLPFELAGFFDLVLYLYTKQDRNELFRNMQTQPAGKYLAKDRSGKLPLVLERNPDMKRIYELYTGGE